MEFVISICFSGGLDLSGDFCDMVFRKDWTFLEDIMIRRKSLLEDRTFLVNFVI